MPDKKAIQTRFAEQLREFKADFIPRVAEFHRPVLGNVPVKPDERRRRWWQEEKGWTPEHEMELLGFNPDGTPAIDPQTGQPRKPMSRQDVGLLKYPMREIDARAASDNGEDDRAIATYARDMTALGPPEPDPLEQAAMAVEAPEPASPQQERPY